jgi:hypothetical protein
MLILVTVCIPNKNKEICMYSPAPQLCNLVEIPESAQIMYNLKDQITDITLLGIFFIENVCYWLVFVIDHLCPRIGMDPDTCAPTWFLIESRPKN